MKPHLYSKLKYHTNTNSKRFSKTIKWQWRCKWIYRRIVHGRSVWQCPQGDEACSIAHLLGQVDYVIITIVIINIFFIVIIALSAFFSYTSNSPVYDRRPLHICTISSLRTNVHDISKIQPLSWLIDLKHSQADRFFFSFCLLSRDVLDWFLPPPSVRCLYYWSSHSSNPLDGGAISRASNLRLSDACQWLSYIFAYTFV